MPAMQLVSEAFAHQGEIPALYTCEGQDISPPLSIKEVPEDTESLALIVEDPDAPDPDAPKAVWVHWLVYNIPPDTVKIDAGGPLPQGAQEGENDWHRAGWGGPCPPIGRHRYFFRLFALDTTLDGLDAPSKKELLNAMGGHILAKSELMGTFQK